MITCSIRSRIKTYIESSSANSGNEVKVVVGWVPGHNGVQGNEDADGIAKEATIGEKDSRFPLVIGEI